MFRSHADEIRAVLLDLTMPDMSGEEVFRTLRTIRPEVKVIDFAVNVDADDSTVSLGPGDSHDTTITLHRRGNSNGTVEFELGGKLPDGVSWEFNPPRAVVDIGHPTVHTKLTLTADSSADTSGSEKCHVRVLKGTNVDTSDDIDVTLTVPVVDPQASKPKKKV